MVYVIRSNASSGSFGSEPQLVPVDDSNQHESSVINSDGCTLIPLEVSFAFPTSKVKEDSMVSTVQKPEGNETSASKKRGRPSHLEQNVEYWKKVCDHVVQEYQYRISQNSNVSISEKRNHVVHSVKTKANKKQRQGHRNKDSNQDQVLTSQNMIQEQQVMNGMIEAVMKSGKFKINNKDVFLQCFPTTDGNNDIDSRLHTEKTSQKTEQSNEQYCSITIRQDEKNPQTCRWQQCTKRIVHGGLPFCTTHGGGLRCKFPGCKTNARAGGNLYCTRHGGGNRCQVKGCPKGAASGGRPFCINHGGGRRCQYKGCEKGAQGNSKSKFCRNHGRLVDGTKV